MKLYIKNMVCKRCKTIVRGELAKIGAQSISVELGEANIIEELSSEQLSLLSKALRRQGFELIEQDRYHIIESLKKAIIDLEHFSDEDLNTGYSDFISARLNASFSSLNTMFSEMEGITIEKYIINHKIELIKELLIYNKLNIDDIAKKMHYSNTAKLSSQFKRITGLTPLHFRELWLCNNHSPECN